MNVNYKGSIADRKMSFTSSLDVTSAKEGSIFNAISIYVPLSFAAANIVDFDTGVVTKTAPAVITCTVDNYASEMQGDLLAQFKSVFRDDTNSDVVLYLIVFWDTDAAETMWTYGTKSITFTPLTTAFSKLYFISYLKVLFDPDYTGENVAVPGTASTAKLAFANGGAAAHTLTAGTYTFSDGTKTWSFTLAADQEVAASGSLTNVSAAATTVGVASLVNGSTVLYSAISPAISSDFTITASSVVAGTAATTRTSTYFDLALALSYLATTNIKLSCVWHLVRVDIEAAEAVTDTNKCWIRSKTAAEEAAAMTSIATKDRSKYFWGAHKLMETENVFIAADCTNEDRNILSIILAAWFASTNGTGLYVGNKLSLLRLTGQNCFGLASPLDALYNTNDEDGFTIFDAKYVGYLSAISSSSNADAALSACRGVTGFPINALMIAKYADYTSSNACADMITDKGTLTNPVLTDESAYKLIQNIAIGNISAFSVTGRISNVLSAFPSFEKAKVSSTALKAASSWTAQYVDDLDTVTVSGGITA